MFYTADIDVSVEKEVILGVQYELMSSRRGAWDSSTRLFFIFPSRYPQPS